LLLALSLAACGGRSSVADRFFNDLEASFAKSKANFARDFQPAIADASPAQLSDPTSWAQADLARLCASVRRPSAPRAQRQQISAEARSLEAPFDPPRAECALVVKNSGDYVAHRIRVRETDGYFFQRSFVENARGEGVARDEFGVYGLHANGVSLFTGDYSGVAAPGRDAVRPDRPGWRMRGALSERRVEFEVLESFPLRSASGGRDMLHAVRYFSALPSSSDNDVEGLKVYLARANVTVLEAFTSEEKRGRVDAEIDLIGVVYDDGSPQIFDSRTLQDYNDWVRFLRL